MKASDLIKELESLISTHGDLEVLTSDNEYGSVEIGGIEYNHKPYYNMDPQPSFVIHQT